MKEQKNIDDFFKNGISGYKAEPSGKVWDEIETTFFVHKGITFKWYYVGAAILLLLLMAGGIWYYYFDNQQSRIVEDKAIESTNTEFENKIPESTVISVQKETDQSQKTELTGMEDKTIANKKETVRKELTTNNKRIEKYAVYNKQETKSYVDRLAETESKNDENISILDPLWINLYSDPGTGFINPVQFKGLEDYFEKQRKSHFYTGITAKPGMIYYPSTTDQFTWSAGLDFGLTAGKFYFETGIEYYNTKERGIYSIELRSLDSVGYYNRVESFELDPSDPDQIIYNTKEVTVYDSINHYTHTTPYFKYQYINIPVSVGTNLFSNEKFTASVNTGVILSLMMNKNIPAASYFDPDYTIVRIQNNTPERVDWNLIWKLGIRLNYNLTKSVSFSAEPVFTKYLNSIYDTKKGYSDIKPYSMGLRVGIYYGF